MKERPILFSAPMVRAILAGNKTVTRRVVKFNVAGRVGRLSNQWSIESPGAVAACPCGQPGDRLWVRETFGIERCVEHDQPPPHDDGRPIKCDASGGGPEWLQPHYRATDAAPDLCCERERCAQCRDGGMGPHWKPSIHMPRWASRITLEITGVRVERLQDISEADALAEGIAPVPGRPAFTGGSDWWDTPIDAFGALWESISGADSWDTNPWVWVVEFKRITQGEPA